MLLTSKRIKKIIYNRLIKKHCRLSKELTMYCLSLNKKKANETMIKIERNIKRIKK